MLSQNDRAVPREATESLASPDLYLQSNSMRRQLSSSNDQHLSSAVGYLYKRVHAYWVPEWVATLPFSFSIRRLALIYTYVASPASSLGMS